jgi:hypothetical protein
MRLKHLDPEYWQKNYIKAKEQVEAFEFRGQSSWFFHASDLVRLAKTAYALGRPLEESRSWLRQATNAYRELFALRGTSFSHRGRFENGKLIPEETVASDGYTSVDSFHAAMAALTLGDIDLARELVELAGHSPNGAFVSPRSEICTTNQQTLSHALNALILSDMDLANHEAGKFAVRRATKLEQQIALTISALATKRDVLAERDALLFYHEKIASQRDNRHDISYWLCLPALGLSFLAMHFGRYAPAELTTDCVYCPIALFTGSQTAAG